MFELCESVFQIMKEFSKPWFIAGGWALDLFLGKETRQHEDIEVGFFRKDQHEFKGFLFGKTIEYCLDNVKHVWKDETLELPIHELYAVINNVPIEFLINESDDYNWVFRRDKTIKRNLENSVRINSHSIPYLAPEIVLLYKLKNPREKDRVDYNNVIDSMNQDQKNWYSSSKNTYGKNKL